MINDSVLIASIHAEIYILNEFGSALAHYSTVIVKRIINGTLKGLNHHLTLHTDICLFWFGVLFRGIAEWGGLTHNLHIGKCYCLEQAGRLVPFCCSNM